MKSKRFVKMHGAGNDFVVVQPQFFGLSNKRQAINTFTEEEKSIMAPQIVDLCRQRFSVGADGVLVVSEIEHPHYKMSIFNADGSLDTNCGNGLRCVAVYLHKTKQVGNSLIIGTDSGNKQAEVSVKDKEYYARINLNSPSPIQQLKITLNNQAVKDYLRDTTVYSCGVGNPHYILFLQQSQYYQIQKDNAYALIADQLVKKELINVNFCCVKSRNDLEIVTCETGVGVTLACGTGSSASAYVGWSSGRLEKEVRVHTRGGVLVIGVQKKGEDINVFLNGPAKWVFTGEIEQ